MTISELRKAYDEYCETGLGDFDGILHQAMRLIEASNAKIADERRCNAELRIHLNRLRQSILDTLDQPPEYAVASPEATPDHESFQPDAMALPLDELLRRNFLIIP